MAHGNQHHIFYTGRHMAYVRINITKLTMKQMADHFGVSADGLKKRITQWRNKGYRIPNGKNKDVGTTSYRMRNGKNRLYIKTVNGWRLADVLPKNTKRKRGKYVKQKSYKQPKLSPPNKQLKPVTKKEKVYPTIEQDMTNKVSVYIPELRMRVFVDQNKTIAQVREKYLSQREFMNKSTDDKIQSPFNNW